MHQLLDQLLPRAYPIGIDLGASGAKVVQLGRGSNGLRLLGMFRLDSPDSAPTPAPERFEEMVRAIARRVIGGGFRGRQCVVSMDDRLLRTRAFRQPRMPDAEIDAAVRLDGAQRLGFAEDEACEVGWIRAGEVHQGDEIREEVIYVGSPREPLRRLAMGLAESGLRPSAIEPGFVGLTRCFGRSLRRTSDLSVVRVLVDVGQRSTGVLLTRGSRVSFYKPLELGGAEMTRIAAERLGLEPQTVNDLRRQRMARVGGGVEGIDPKVDRALYDVVRPLLGDLAHEVNLCVRHYCVTFRGSRPTACLIVGGEALEPHLTEALQDALQIETSIGLPLEGVEGVRGVGDGRDAHAEFGVAAGLSLRPLDVRSAEGWGLMRRTSDRGDESESASDVRQAA